MGVVSTVEFERSPKRSARPPTPQSVRGRYRTIKTVVAVTLLAIFFITPWLRWDRGATLPNQAVLFDLPGRRLFLLGLELWPQDLPIAVGALILGACGLFAATTVAGRVWCGFACPQTVWTDMFFAVERLTDRLLGRGSLAAKAARLAVWLVLAALTGFGFTTWFADAPRLPLALFTGAAPFGIYLTIGILTLTTWLLAAYARERVCLHMCPWPRFQAALLDRDSMVVTYQAPRGEPRGKKREPLRPDLHDLQRLAAQAGDLTPMLSGRGDCIDCNRCVSVCPTNIDIREGLQMGCIGCGLCVDACDDIMVKIDRPKGLIRFDSEASQAIRSPVAAKPAIFRPKVVLYAIICTLAVVAMGFGVHGMRSLNLDIDPQRNPPFVLLSNGDVRNDYSLRLAHRRARLDGVSIAIEGVPGAQLRPASSSAAPTSRLVVAVGTNRQATDRLSVIIPAAQVQSGRRPVRFAVSDARTGAPLTVIDSYVWGPGT